MFRQIKGQDKAIKLLNNALNHERIAQSYLFHGPEGVGKFTTALYFGMALNCLAVSDRRPCGACNSCHKFLEFNHPDFTYLFPTPVIKVSSDGEMKSQSQQEYLSYVENRKNTPWAKTYFSSNAEIRIESIRLLQKKLEFTQREGNYRICIIEDADEMNHNTANAFLKTLEEPVENTVLILLTTRIQSMLPTIVSRCQLVYFPSLSYKIIEDILINRFMAEKSTARLYSKIANGNLEQAIRLTSDANQESRSLMFNILEAVTADDDLFIINLLSKKKEKLKSELVHDLLSNLALWFHDTATLSINVKDLNNQDNLELLNKCRTMINQNADDISETLVFLDDLHRKVDGNVNLQLIMINLYNYLDNLLNNR